jgi:hypothetical protein
VQEQLARRARGEAVLEPAAAPVGEAAAGGASAAESSGTTTG